jgi:hypothetical protein
VSVEKSALKPLVAFVLLDPFERDGLQFGGAARHPDGAEPPLGFPRLSLGKILHI